MLPKKQQLMEEDIRRQLAGAIGKQVRDDVWDQLVEDFYVQEVIDGQDGAFSCLKKKYLKLNERFSSIAPKKPTEKHEMPPDNRLRALAEIAAIEAAKLPEVVSFREEVLKGQLVTIEEIPAWIKSQTDEGGGTSTLWVGYPLPPGGRVMFPEGPTFEWLESLKDVVADKTTKWPLRIETEYLDYPELINGYPHRGSTLVDRGTVLWRLKLLTKHLAQVFAWWQEAQAVGFVLADTVPLLRKAVGKTTWGGGPSRVQLDLDCRLSSQEVAAFYAKVRRHVFAGRDKPMSEKHLALPVFLAEHPNSTWKQTMEAWNEAKKEEWAYSDWRAFARDASAAWRRVTGGKWIKGGS